MKTTKLLATMITLGLASQAYSAVIDTVTQSGNRQDDAVGIQFQVDTGLPAFSGPSFTLDTFTFRQGIDADSVYFLNIYEGTATGSTDFTPGSENVSDLTFLGASDNSVDWGLTTNGSANYTFTGVTLSADTDIFVVLSTTTASGSFALGGFHTNNGGPWNNDADFNNLLAVNYDELNDEDGATGIIWSASVTAIPEPSSIVLMVAALGAILAFRRGK